MIRAAVAADADAIAAIWNRVIRDTTQTFTTEEKDAAALARQMATQPYLVAGEQGAVTGFVTYFQFRGGPGYAYTVEHSVHIAVGARGRGLGRALMAACEDHARGRGMHSIIAGVAGENAGGAAFHAALGYRQIARLPEVGWKFGRWHDLVLMQKML
ncbi:GNAT family N-acetyltransferase [Roseicyclus persicicus]|uniref:N-acetyltransferase n=1 Tax=Roseicyclus persicicus TaxID=2650661 RepID=A0A7X6JVK9_9RHOB|nr:N-acetyltransferase [Roseibacterium persicicum]